MNRIAFLALIGLLFWGAPAFGQTSDVGDFDGDGILDNFDNCSTMANPAQDDTDGDDCGNICDADYNQNGAVTLADCGIFVVCFGKTGCPEQQHVEPISGDNIVNIADFGYFAYAFGKSPGPSGTTAGTIACPSN